MIPDRNAAWTWFQQPIAQHIGGKTYLGYVDQRGNIKAYSYDHAADEAEEAILNGNLFRDDHVAPILYQRSDGRFIALYARSDTGLRQRISANPDDITEWGPERTIYDDEINYPNPVTLNGDIHLFTRRDTFNQYFRVSSDGGESWSAPTQVSDFDTRCYLKQNRLDSSRTYLALTSNAGGRFDELFCVYYDADDGQFVDVASGASFGDADLPIAEGDLTTIHEATDDRFGALWMWDVAAISTDDIRILYVDTSDTAAHSYHEARYDGTNWTTETITTTTGSPSYQDNYAGGMCYSGVSPDTVYLSVEANGEYEIHTADRTDNWSLTQITSGSSEPQWRPIRVKNAPAELPAVWLQMRHYDHFTNYMETATSELNSTAQPEEPVTPKTNPAQGLYASSGGELVRLRSITEQ